MSGHTPWRHRETRRNRLIRYYWMLRRLFLNLFGYAEWRFRVRQFIGFFVRGWRGWADHDAWGVDSYLAGVMAGMLRRLADHHHGVPPDFLPDEGRRYDPEYPGGDYTMEDIDAADVKWTAWLREKAAWLEWYANDEDGVTGDTNWIDPDLTQEERHRRIDAHTAKMKRFHEEVMPDLGRHWGSLWD